MVRKKQGSKIVSLGSFKQEQDKLRRKVYLTPQERLSELEADLLRVIEFSLELEERLDSQARLLRGLIRALRQVSSSDAASTSRQK
jgi:hypothetical protein